MFEATRNTVKAAFEASACPGRGGPIQCQIFHSGSFLCGLLQVPRLQSSYKATAAPSPAAVRVSRPFRLHGILLELGHLWEQHDELILAGYEPGTLLHNESLQYNALLVQYSILTTNRRPPLPTNQYPNLYPNLYPNHYPNHYPRRQNVYLRSHQ